MAISYISGASNGNGFGTGYSFDNTANALGIQANDIVIAFFEIDLASAETINAPTGTWNDLSNFFNSSHPMWHRSFWMRQSGSVLTSFDFTWTSNAFRGGSLAVLRGALSSGNIINQSSSTNTGFGATLTANAVTPNVDGTYLIGLYGGANGGGMTTSDLTEGTNTDSGTTMIGHGVGPASGVSSGTKTATMPAADQWAAQLFALVEEPSGSIIAPPQSATTITGTGSILGFRINMPDEA